jgi:hypothetical protein
VTDGHDGFCRMSRSARRFTMRSTTVASASSGVPEWTAVANRRSPVRAAATDAPAEALDSAIDTVRETTARTAASLARTGRQVRGEVAATARRAADTVTRQRRRGHRPEAPRTLQRRVSVPKIVSPQSATASDIGSSAGASTSGATSDPQDKKSVGTDPHPPTLLRSSAAEALGTALLVIGGVGTAVIAGDTVGDLGVALAFGPSAAGRERGSRSVSC